MFLDWAMLYPHTQHQHACREVGARLLRACHARDEAAALQLLSAHPQAAWARDSVPQHEGRSRVRHAPGPYPAHLAVFYGLPRLLEQLVALPGVVLVVL